MGRIATLLACALLPLLLPAARAQDASPLAGPWENAGYAVALKVTGSTVSGAFTRYTGGAPIRGTVSGQVGADGRSFTAAWKQEIAGETETFSSSLSLAPHGKVLSGTHWGFAGQDSPTMFTLRRGVSGKRGSFLDQDTVDQGQPAPVPPPTNDPPFPSDEEPLMIQPRPEPPVTTPVPAPVQTASPGGLWEVVINTIPGQMELKRTAGKWSGRLNLDTDWEPLERVTFDAGSGGLTFVRASVDQHYIGTLSGNSMKGTFGDAQDQTYWEWSAKRNAAGGQSTAPVVTGDPVTLLDNSNAVGVRNGPTAPTVFTIGRPHILTYIRTYHWNGGKGAAPGTIALRGADGKQYGPWKATGTGDNAGRKNLMWVVEPKVLLPAGKYTVVDSDPATWGCNDQSGKAGFAWINGIPQ